MSPTQKLAYARALAATIEPDHAYADEIEECKRLEPFIEKAWHCLEPGTEYKGNWHIGAAAEYLEAVTAGQITRLLVNEPPRYMKSIEFSILWPIWEWTLRPELRYMFTTYAQSLSDDHSRSRLVVLKSDWFRERWGAKVRLESENIYTVSNSRRGVFTATSFSGTATGKGGNRVVVDDPHNPKKAESKLERETAVVAFDRTFSNRLNDKKRDAIVVVMQRLHQKDVAARCIELGYTHLCLPAEAIKRTVVVMPSGREHVREAGTLLWPEREGPEEIAKVKLAMGSYGYAGQYQQEPAPGGGGIFKEFPVVDFVPTGSRYVRYWDKAGTEGDGDYSVGVLMARTPDDTYIVADVVRGQWSANSRETIMKRTAETDGKSVHIWIEQEPGSGGKDSAAWSVKSLAGYVIRAERATGTKEARAQPLAAQAEAGNVRLLKSHWNGAFIDEAQLFPRGAHDDQIDAASGAFNRLALEYRPQAGAVAPPDRPPAIPTGRMR